RCSPASSWPPPPPKADQRQHALASLPRLNNCSSLRLSSFENTTWPTGTSELSVAMTSSVTDSPNPPHNSITSTPSFTNARATSTASCTEGTQTISVRKDGFSSTQR